MLEHNSTESQPDYEAAFKVAAAALQSAGEVDMEYGFSFAQRGQVLAYVSQETITPHGKQEALEQVSAITEDPLFLKAAVRYARRHGRHGALDLSGDSRSA